MYKVIISVAFLLFSIHANAQLDSATLKLKYEKEVIYFSGGRYVKGDVQYNFKNLKNEFGFSVDGMNMYKMYQSDYQKQRLYGALFLVTYISGIVIGVNTGGNVATAIIIGSLIPMGVSFHFAFRADKRMKKAIWLRNRDVLLR